MFDYVFMPVVMVIYLTLCALRGLFGAFIFSVPRLLRLSVTTLAELFVFLSVASLVVLEASGYLYSNTPIGFLGAAIFGLMSYSALIALSLVLVPSWGVTRALQLLFSESLRGFFRGFNYSVYIIVEDALATFFDFSNAEDDFFGVEGASFEKMKRKMDQSFYEHHDARAGQGDMREEARGPRREEAPPFVPAPERQQRDPTGQRMTLEQFQQCQLQGAELERLKESWRPPLLPNEIQRLRRIPKASRELELHSNIERLTDEVCSVSMERPEIEDTVLLVKQYLHHGQWSPVPGCVFVHDKTFLQQYFTTTSARHPTNRDFILNPSVYSKDNVDHATRYVIHPYYIGWAGAGLSQEACLLNDALRKHLEPAVPTAACNDELLAKPGKKKHWFK